MKKLDLHIHTKATISDVPFTFDIDNLKEYVEKYKLDCIAITNHNLFDEEQFQLIQQSLKILVLPGIEINIENGHILLITRQGEISDFSSKCEKVYELIKTKDDSITVQQLVEIYGDLSKYLIIPHYDKRPCCTEDTLKSLAKYIDAGEVNSIKKFLYCQKEQDKLTPVYFSDIRIKTDMKNFIPRQTYFDIDEISLESIKLCLQDKSKVQLSEEEGHEVFQVLDNGIKISTGLTVILGERSSGKTHTLNEICKNYENVKYIKQFSLLEKDEKKDEERFNKLLSNRQSSVAEEFLREFKIVVDDVVGIDRENNDRCIENYVESLLKNANESQREDAFSKAILFNEAEYSNIELDNLKVVIDAVKVLIENKEYEHIINTFVSREKLIQLIRSLINEYRKKHKMKMKQDYVNDIVRAIKGNLKMKTAVTSVSDIDFYNIALERIKIKKFEKLVNYIRHEHTIQEKNQYDFKIVVTTSRFSNASELRSLGKSKGAFSEAYKEYDNAYIFLQELKKIGEIEMANYYKYFVKINFKVLNKYNFDVSGGERSEFNLLNEINDALQYDMLLLDEPESSFDNLFLRNSVNQTIKDISKKIPVVVVTHNNTVGASIKPDYLLFTKKEIINNNVLYDIYSGYPTNKQLVSLNGKKFYNHDILLNCLCNLTE